MTDHANILAAVKTRLESISSVYGFSSDLGSNIQVNMAKPFDKNETLPGCNIRDPEDVLIQKLVSGENTVEDRRLFLPVDVFVREGSDDAARELIDDVRAAIGIDETFGGLAIQTEIEEPEKLDVEHQERRVSGVTIPLVITYRRTVWGTKTITIPSFSLGFDLGFQS